MFFISSVQVYGLRKKTVKKAVKQKFKVTLTANFYPLLPLLPYGKRRKRYFIRMVKDWSSFYCHYSRYHSPKQSQQIIKSVFTFAKMRVLGQDVSLKLPFPFRSGPYGLPNKLWRIGQWLESGDNNLIRLSLTVLNGFRLLESEPTPEYSSIECPPPYILDDAFDEFYLQEAKNLRKKTDFIKLPKRDFAETLLFTKGVYGSKGSFESMPCAASLLFSELHLLATSTFIAFHGNNPAYWANYLMQCASRAPFSSLSNLAAEQDGKRLSRLPTSVSVLAYSLEVSRRYNRRFWKLDWWNSSTSQRLEQDVAALEGYLSNYAQWDFIKKRGLGPAYAERFRRHKGFFPTKRLSWVDPYLGRLTFIPKEGGGSRPVTPINYFIQDALKPTHDFLMNTLRHTAGDCTYDESYAIEFLRRHTRIGSQMTCVDWTAATDCDDIRHSGRLVIKAFLGKELSDAWLTLMRLPIVTRRDCLSEDGVRRTLMLDPSGKLKHERDSHGSDAYAKIKFKKGAPMGIYSLWPSYTLGHHCLARLAIRLAELLPDSFEIPNDFLDPLPGLTEMFVKESTPNSGNPVRYRLKESYARRLRFNLTKPLLDELVAFIVRIKGDDVSFSNKLVAYVYCILCYLRGNPQSAGKLVRPGVALPSSGEMVKSIWRGGHDLTPVSPKKLKSSLVDNATVALFDIACQLMRWFDKTIRDPTYVGSVRKAVAGLVRGRRGGLEPLFMYITCPFVVDKYSEPIARLGLDPKEFWPDLPNWCYEILWNDATVFLRQQLAFEVYKAYVNVPLPEGIEITSEKVSILPDHPLLSQPGEYGGPFVPLEERSIALLINEIQNLTAQDLLSNRWEVPRALDLLMRSVSFSRQLRGHRHRAYSFSFMSRPLQQMYSKARYLSHVMRVSKERLKDSIFPFDVVSSSYENFTYIFHRHSEFINSRDPLHFAEYALDPKLSPVWGRQACLNHMRLHKRFSDERKKLRDGNKPIRQAYGAVKETAVGKKPRKRSKKNSKRSDRKRPKRALRKQIK